MKNFIFNDKIIYHSENGDIKAKFGRYCEKLNKVIIYDNDEIKVVDIEDIELVETCGFKTYRHKDNPKEKELHDYFIKEHIENKHTCDPSLLVFPVNNGTGFEPCDHLSEREKRIVISTIQWLGSPVGQSFLNECGFENKNEE